MNTILNVALIVLVGVSPALGQSAQQQTEANGDAPIGAVTKVDATVLVKHQGKEKAVPLKASDSIYAGDVISTNEVGRVQVRLTDETLLDVEPQSVLFISSSDELGLTMDVNSHDYSTSMTLESGKLRVAVKTAGSQISLRTRTADVASLEPATYVIEAQPKFTKISSVKGKVSVNSVNPRSPQSPSVPLTILHSGESVSVPPTAH